MHLKALTKCHVVHHFKCFKRHRVSKCPPRAPYWTNNSIKNIKSHNILSILFSAFRKSILILYYLRQICPSLCNLILGSDNSIYGGLAGCLLFILSTHSMHSSLLSVIFDCLASVSILLVFDSCNCQYLTIAFCQCVSVFDSCFLSVCVSIWQSLFVSLYQYWTVDFCQFVSEFYSRF